MMMKWNLAIVSLLLIGLLLISGCTSSNPSGVTTPTPVSQDPIAGIWIVSGNPTFTLTFSNNGKYSQVNGSNTANQLSGNWEKIRENEYLVTTTNGKTLSIIYHPTTDTIALATHPEEEIHRIGASSPPLTSSTAPATPIVTVGTQTETVETVAPAQPPSVTAQVKILGHSSYLDSIGVLHLVGEVENVGTTNLEFIKIIATFYDASNTVIGTEFTYADVDILVPNQKSPFDIMESTNVDNIKSFKLQATYEETTNVPYVGLKVLSTSSHIDSISVLHIVGEVENTGNMKKSFVKVIGTFYDSSGQIIDTDFTYSDPSDISAGQTAPFDLMVSSPKVSQIKTYTLYVQGD